MALVKVKPTSPGRRGMVKVVNADLYKGRPFPGLIEKKSKSAGRNNNGHITTRHVGGGHKRKYRIIDFKRSKTDVPAKVLSIEYDPNRTSRIALICYQDGVKSYIVCPVGLSVGDTVISSSTADIKPGNCLPLSHIPVGATIHNIEVKPGSGAQVARGAGVSAVLLGKEEKFCLVRLPSGEVKKFLSVCSATIGQVGNTDNENIAYGKAGRSRWRGIRPTVRGMAMNPVDHPLGGGEGVGKGHHPVSPWGAPCKGYKTRNNKRTDWSIVKRRK
jgi:large subunit ribosomal protein L2